jgi:aspartyl protease family protein
MGIQDQDGYRDAQRKRDKQRQLDETRNKFAAFSSKNLGRQTNAKPSSPRQTGQIPMMIFWCVVMGLLYLFT